MLLLISFSFLSDQPSYNTLFSVARDTVVHENTIMEAYIYIYSHKKMSVIKQVCNPLKV